MGGLGFKGLGLGLSAQRRATAAAAEPTQLYPQPEFDADAGLSLSGTPTPTVGGGEATIPVATGAVSRIDATALETLTAGNYDYEIDLSGVTVGDTGLALVVGGSSLHVGGASSSKFEDAGPHAGTIETSATTQIIRLQCVTDDGAGILSLRVWRA